MVPELVKDCHLFSYSFISKFLKYFRNNFFFWVIKLREILEDKNGIQIRDALYDQFMQFFDLYRDQQVYITSLCECLKLPSAQKINFFKVNTNIITNQISEFIANSIENQPECLQKLEDEFKKELWKNHALKK